jgi:hypothetical protein
MCRSMTTQLDQSNFGSPKSATPARDLEWLAGAELNLALGVRAEINCGTPRHCLGIFHVCHSESDRIKIRERTSSRTT